MSDSAVKTAERKEERDLFTDFLKGFAVILVVWGHAIQYCYGGTEEFYENPLFKFIYSFHMPLFMIISGYLCYHSVKKYSYEQFFVKRLKGIVVPFFIFGFLCAVAGNINNLYDFLSFKGVYNFFNYILYIGYWFLFAVFVCSMIMVLIEKSFSLYHTENRIFKILLYILAIVCGAYVCSVLPYENQTLYMYPYFVIGFLYFKFKDKIPDMFKRIFGMISIIAFIVMLFFFRREHYIYITGMFLPEPSKGFAQIPIDLFRYGIGLFGSISVIFVLRMLNKILSKKIVNIFVVIGKYSLQFYLLQRLLVEFIFGSLFSELVVKLGSNPLTGNIYLYNMVITPLITIVFAAIMYAIIKLLYKLKRFSAFIFGR